MGVKTGSAIESKRRAGRASALLAAALLLAGLPARPAQAQENQAGYIALSVLTSLLYTPAKIVYATGGSIIGGLAWAVSAGDNQVARTVITPAVYGDYVVMPSHLRGSESLEFIGRGPR